MPSRQIHPNSPTAKGPCDGRTMLQNLVGEKAVRAVELSLEAGDGAVKRSWGHARNRWTRCGTCSQGGVR